MGDADSQAAFPAEEIEAWMDGAMIEMEDGMDNLFIFMQMLNERTARLTSEIGSWKKFRRCFTALNLFAIPVVIAAGLALSCKVLGIDVETQALQHNITTFLMYIWGTICLPIFVFTMWNTYVAEDKLNKSLPSRRVRSIRCETTDDQTRNSDFSWLDSDHLISPSTQNSVERFSEFGRTIIDQMRQERERRASQIFEVSPMVEQDSEIEVPATDEDQRAVINQQMQDSGSEELFETRFVRLGADEGNSCGVNVIIVNPSSGLSVEIQKNYETPNETEDGQPQTEECILLDLRKEQEPRETHQKTFVETVGEGDRYSALYKDTEDIGDWQMQGFGL